MPYFSLRTLWRILPVGVFGISSSLMKVMFFGTLKPAILALQKLGIMSACTIPRWAGSSGTRKKECYNERPDPNGPPVKSTPMFFFGMCDPPP